MNLGPLEQFKQLSSVLRLRSIGRRVAAPDWIDPDLIEALSLSLGVSGTSVGELAIRVTLKDGQSARALPPRLRGTASAVQEETMRLLPVRGCRALGQAVPSIEREAWPRNDGVITCLVRDQLNPLRQYVLTCGHVMAPPGATARFGDAAILSDRVDGNLCRRVGHLAEWQPDASNPDATSRMDAALVALDSADAIALQGRPDLLPSGVSSELRANLGVRVQRARGVLSGSLRVHWSGPVDLSQAPNAASVFLEDMIGYASDEPTLGGDSGSAIWTLQRELLGMHIGALPDAAMGEANAIMGPIAPVLEWFAVQPYLDGDPATMAPDLPSVDGSLPISAGGPAQQDRLILAKTLWGEARGEGEQGMRAVACVIQNRLRTQYRGRTTAAAVCLDPLQFSCWNREDPNRRLFDGIENRADPLFKLAQRIADELMQGKLQDNTHGARHYFASSIAARPSWARGKHPCQIVGGHEFFNDVA